MNKTINGTRINNFLRTLRKLKLVPSPSQVIFRPSFMPDMDDMSIRLTFIHLIMKNKNGEIKKENSLC